MKLIKLNIVYLCILISINAYAKKPCDPCEKKRDGIIIEPGTKVN